MFDETLYQKTKDGKQFVDVLSAQGIFPGIKVDTGLEVSCLKWCVVLALCGVWPYLLLLPLPGTPMQLVHHSACPCTGHARRPWRDRHHGP